MRRLAIVILALAALDAAAHAQSRFVRFARADANGDGGVTLQEALTAVISARLFDFIQADTNRDQILSEVEWRRFLTEVDNEDRRDE